jgi:hypothetical protein
VDLRVPGASPDSGSSEGARGWEAAMATERKVFHLPSAAHATPASGWETEHARERHSEEACCQPPHLPPQHPRKGSSSTFVRPKKVRNYSEQAEGLGEVLELS